MTKRIGAKRRGAGEHSVYRRADGTWVAAIDLGTGPDGQRHRIVRKAQTKKEVLAKLKEAAAARVDSGITDTSGMTLGRFLHDWLNVVIAARVGDNTADFYRIVIDRHIAPALGKTPLVDLTPEQVDQFLADKAERYSKSYVGRMRSLLIDALTHAERRQLVTRNVAALSVMPKTKAPEPRRSFSTTETRALLEAAEADRLGAMIVVGLNLALRPGELTGLLWEDLDLAAGTLAITGSMKRLNDSTLYRGDVKRSTAGKRTIGAPGGGS